MPELKLIWRKSFYGQRTGTAEKPAVPLVGVNPATNPRVWWNPVAQRQGCFRLAGSTTQ